MNHQEEIEETLREIQGYIDWNIAFVKKVQRRREILAVLNVVAQMSSAMWNFYHFHYVKALIDVACAMGMSCFSFWILGLSIKMARARKRELAELKMRGQQILENWRGYRN
jgi:hypothetical protein